MADAAKKAPAAKKASAARKTTGADTPGPTLRERLGWRLDRRPEPGFAHVLAAGAGAFAVAAMVAIVIEISSDDLTLPGVLFSVALAAVALVLGARVGPGPLRSGFVTILVLTTPFLWGFALLGDGNGDSSSIRGVYILSALTYGFFYLLTWTRGRNVMLGLALLVATSWIVIAAEGRESTVFPFQGTIQQRATDPFQGTSGFNVDLVGGDTTAAAVVALVIGLGLLWAGMVLDRRKLRGSATPFIAVGAIFSIAGAVALGSEQGAWLGGLLAAAAGAAVGIVGGMGEDRRGSTWIGVLAVVGGLGFVIGDITHSTLGVAGLTFLVALLLGAAAFLLAPRLEEAPEGDRQAAG